MRLLRTNLVFTRFWTAGFFFLLAWWSLHIVMLVHVFELTGSSFATGLIPVFASIPGILFGPIAGVLVDRWNRKRVMATSALILVALLVLTLPLGNDVNVEVLYVIIFIQAFVMTFFSPAENALLPTLVGERDLSTANSLNALNDNLGRIIGPAVGAWGLVQFGFMITIAICAVLYLTGWAVLLGVRYERPVSTDTRAASLPGIGPLVRSVWHDLGEGLRFIGNRPLLMMVVGIFGLFMVSDVSFGAVLPAFVGDSLHKGPEGLGTMMPVRGATGVIGGLLVVWLSRRVTDTRLLAGGLLVYGTSIFMIGAFNSFPIALLMAIPNGPANAAISTGILTLLQKASPDALRGRVFGVVGTINGLTVVVASLVAGSLGEVVGTRAVVIAAGCLHVLPFLLALALIRRMAVSEPIYSTP